MAREDSVAAAVAPDILRRPDVIGGPGQGAEVRRSAAINPVSRRRDAAAHRASDMVSAYPARAAVRVSSSARAVSCASVARCLAGRDWSGPVPCARAAG